MNLNLYFYNTKINQINNNFHLKQKVNKPIPVQNSMVYATMPSFAYQSFYCPNVSFKGEVNKIDENIYSNTEKFAEYFETKLQKQMKVKTEQDIQNVIDKTMEITGVDEKTVCKVISRLTQFSDYSHLEDLENSLHKGYYNKLTSPPYPFTVNSPLYYLSNRKKQFLNEEDKYKYTPLYTSCFFVDNFFLDYAESLDKESNEFFLCKYKMEDSVSIDGWNKKGISHTIFGHNNDLLTSTLAVVMEMQETGKNLDDVLNGDFIQRCKDIFGDEAESIPTILNNYKQVDLNAKAIAEHIKPKMPTKEQIVKFVDVIADNIELMIDENAYTIEQKKEFICKCLDESFEPYSTERLNVAMKDMYKKIEEKVSSVGKTMDDVVYVIPCADKSYSLISYHYAMANNIPNDKFLFDDFSTSGHDTSKKPLEKGKVYVVLDDVAGSGESLAGTQRIRNFINLIFNDKNTNLILAPVYMSENAKKRFDIKIEENERENTDFYISDVKAERSFVHDLFEGEYKSVEVAQFLGGTGYRGVATFVMFPFCITDTNAKLASIFSSFFLRYPNQKCIVENITPSWTYTNSFSDITKEIGSYNETNPQYF